MLLWQKQLVLLLHLLLLYLMLDQAALLPLECFLLGHHRLHCLLRWSCHPLLLSDLVLDMLLLLPLLLLDKFCLLQSKLLLLYMMLDFQLLLLLLLDELCLLLSKLLLIDNGCTQGLFDM